MPVQAGSLLLRLRVMQRELLPVLQVLASGARADRTGGRGPHTSSQCTLALALGQLRSCLPLTPQFPHLYAGACHPSCPLEVKSSKAPGCLHLAAGLESASPGRWMRGRAVASWEPSVACQGHCTPGPQPCRRQVIDTRIANP